VFAPALGLGIASLAELCDVRVDFGGSDEELRERLRASAPEGLVIESLRKLGDAEPALSKRLALADYAAWVPGAVEEQALRRANLVVSRLQKGVRKSIDVGARLVEARVAGAAEAAALGEVLEWPAGGTVIRTRLTIADEGSAKPSEVVEALLGAAPPEGTRYARLGLYADGGADLLDLDHLDGAGAAPVAGPPAPARTAVAADPDAAGAGRVAVAGLLDDAASER
jgi:hypothetical protein